MSKPSSSVTPYEFRPRPDSKKHTSQPISSTDTEEGAVAILDKEHEGQPQEHAENAAEQFRTAEGNDRTVSMEVKMLPPVREAAKHIATAHGMTAQEFVEHLLVDSLNKYPKAVEDGKKRLEQFKGNTAAARRFTEREELRRLRKKQQASRDFQERELFNP